MVEDESSVSRWYMSPACRVARPARITYNVSCIRGIVRVASRDERWILFEVHLSISLLFHSSAARERVGKLASMVPINDALHSTIRAKAHDARRDKDDRHIANGQEPLPGCGKVPSCARDKRHLTRALRVVIVEPQEPAQTVGEPDGHERRDDAQQLVEEGDHFGNDEADRPKDRADGDPSGPCALAGGSECRRPAEDRHEDEFGTHVTRHHTRDDDGYERDCVCGDSHGVANRGERRARHVLPREGVDRRAGDDVKDRRNRLDERERVPVLREEIGEISQQEERYGPESWCMAGSLEIARFTHLARKRKDGDVATVCENDLGGGGRREARKRTRQRLRTIIKSVFPRQI